MTANNDVIVNAVVIFWNNGGKVQVQVEGKKYIIYGAGKQGKAYFNLLRQKGLDTDIIGFCDKCYNEIKYVADKKVFSYEEAKNWIQHLL